MTRSKSASSQSTRRNALKADRVIAAALCSPQRLLLILVPPMSRRQHCASGYFHVEQRLQWGHSRRNDQ